MSKVLLMPTAKLVSPELRSEFGPIPSAMIPLDSRPAMQYIAEPFLARGYQLVLGVGERAELVREYTDRHPDLASQLVEIEQPSTLGSTILHVLDSFESEPESLVINFADTFVGDDLEGDDVICYREADEVYRWTTFRIDFGNRISCLSDKDVDNPYGQLQPVFVGVFAIGNVAAFRQRLREAVGSPGPGTDPFYIALTGYFNALPVEQRRLQHVSDWRDFGHLDTYYRTKRAFCINQRFFNTVRIDDQRGVVRKSSSNAGKLLNEMKWYMELPKALRYMAPRVFDYNFGGSESFIELEYYSYPALNDIYLYGNLDRSVWASVFQAIGNVIRQMHSHRFQPAGSGQLQRSMQTMYEQKTKARLEPIEADPRFARFCHPEVLINGKICMGIRECLETLPQVAEAVDLYALDYFTVIHGDLCLSNILYDRRNSFIRVIDPRGEFGDVGIFGDMRYDLAKLLHSLEGDYDFMVNGMIDSHWDAAGFNYRAQTNGRHQAVRELFQRWFSAEFGEYYTQVRLIESLLFLSMVPLHADRFQSQETFLARGLEIFNDVAARAYREPVRATA